MSFDFCKYINVDGWTMEGHISGGKGGWMREGVCRSVEVCISIEP